MFCKIGDFLYRVVHASGRLFSLAVEFGPFRLSLWVGREEPDAVRFAVDVELEYASPGHPMLFASVEVGVIKVDLSLTRSYSE